jgi:hypothetical protein
MGPEPNCGSVVRVSQYLPSDGALGPGEGPQNPVGVGEDEYAASIKQYCRGMIAGRGHAENVHRHELSLVV